MFMFRCCTQPTKQDPTQEREVKAKHLSCPRCRRLLIVPSVDKFRCQCSLIFRVSGAAEGMQLCFSLSDQEANGKGSGLPRELVERLPTVVVSERMCAGTEKGAPVGEGEESKADRDSNDNSEMTCRICLSNYKPGDTVRVLPCFHRFHVSEIDDWLDRNSSCPTCHLDVNEALTGTSGEAFVSVQEGNPRPVIERRRRS
ncbi:unnamed protein product [Pylaiella littoralis]